MKEQREGRNEGKEGTKEARNMHEGRNMKEGRKEGMREGRNGRSK